MIQEAQKAGWQKHDAAGYFAIWGDDGKKVEGRTATPDKFDTVLTRQQFEEVTRMRLAVPAPYGIMVTFSDVQYEVKQDAATVSFKMSLKPAEMYFGWRKTLTTGDSFHLRRVDGKWRIEEHRSWPIDSWGDDFFEKFDASQWEAIDQRVESAQTLPEKAAALEQGRRYAEAYAAAKAYSEQAGMHKLKPKSDVMLEGGAKRPEAWVHRGLLATCVGDATDATASFKRALELDPNAPMPDYARAAAQAK
jgi:hypothetical protein